MKVVILCGGLGSRLAEETKLIPKPMVKIGKVPIVQHIINFYESYGFQDFILATGYKKEFLERYFKKNKRVQCIFYWKKYINWWKASQIKELFQ